MISFDPVVNYFLVKGKGGTALIVDLHFIGTGTHSIVLAEHFNQCLQL